MALGILALAALANTVSSVFDQILLGKDRVDVDESAKFSDYLRSSILFVAKVNIVMAAVYLVAVYVTVTAGIASGLSHATTLDVWAVAQLGVFIVSSLVKWRRVRRIETLVFPSSIGYYAVGAGIMALVLYPLQGFLVYGLGTFALALELVAVSVVGVGAYGVFVLVLDKTLRNFIRTAWRETFGRARSTA